eukprot:355508-Chlamydomonas_euryale.AAC.6
MQQIGRAETRAIPCLHAQVEETYALVDKLSDDVAALNGKLRVLSQGQSEIQECVNRAEVRMQTGVCARRPADP